MKARLMLLLFALAVMSVSLQGCGTQRLCPAYSDVPVENLQGTTPTT